MARGTKQKKRSTESSPVSKLSVLVEIISRVPYKSTRCCNCACWRWRNIVSHPEHSKKLPQSTLAGIFFEAYNLSHHRHVHHGYLSVSGKWHPRIDASLSFLPRCKGQDIDLLDCCNGLLLCRRRSGSYTSDYVVCNVVSDKWVAVPATDKAWIARLGFDPAVSSHFHVFEFVADRVWDASKGSDSRCIGSVGIYSSDARVWTHRSAWDRPIAFYNSSRSVFLDGVLYLSSYLEFVMAAIDVEGNCRAIRYPAPHIGSLDLSQSRGQLYLTAYGSSELSIWVLEDSNSENWILKHNFSNLQLFGEKYSLFAHDYYVIIHPKHSVIFIVCTEAFKGRQSVTKLMSYELDSKDLRFISDLGSCGDPYLPCVPLFSKSLADGHEKS